MRYVEAPQPYQPRPGDGPVVFLAGGITGVADWQAEVVSVLAGEQVVLLNPRRSQFDVHDQGTAEAQIRWEFTQRRHPRLAAMLFWLPACDPAVTVQPIALLELGEALARPDLPIVVGADPSYPRRLDVVLQTRYARPELTVHDTLTDTLTDLTLMLGRADGMHPGRS